MEEMMWFDLNACLSYSYPCEQFEDWGEVVSVLSSNEPSTPTSTMVEQFPEAEESRVNSRSRKRSPSEESRPRKKGKRARLQELARSTPSFIVKELESAKGTGEFTGSEVVIMLFFAYKYFDDFDVYSKVRSCMNFTRSRASIRRKIEKIVAQELNTKGGLLGDYDTRTNSKLTCLKKFWELTSEMMDSGSHGLKQFALQMVEEAENSNMFTV